MVLWRAIVKLSCCGQPNLRKLRDLRNRTGTGNRNRWNRFFPKPKAEPEPPEPFSRNRNRNRPLLLNCTETQKNPFCRGTSATVKRGFWKRGNCVNFGFLGFTFLSSCYLWRLFGHVVFECDAQNIPHAAPQKAPNPSPSQALRGASAVRKFAGKFSAKVRKLSEIVFLTSWTSNTVKQGVRKMSENVEIWPPIFCGPLKCRVHCRPPSALHSPRSNSAV